MKKRTTRIIRRLRKYRDSRPTLAEYGVEQELVERGERFKRGHIVGDVVVDYWLPERRTAILIKPLKKALARDFGDRVIAVHKHTNVITLSYAHAMSRILPKVLPRKVDRFANINAVLGLIQSLSRF